MKQGGFCFGLLLSAFLTIQVQAAVYGEDDRREITSSLRARNLAAGTAMAVSPLYTSKNDDGTLKLRFQPLTTGFHLCPEERFADQPSNLISCAGFLIAPDLLLTAGHCMVNYGEIVDTKNPFCEDLDWLFDYRLNSLGQVDVERIAADRLVKCEKVIYAVNDYDYDAVTGKITYKRDWAVIRLARPMLQRPIFRLRETPILSGTAVEMIGYPSGLPAKLTANGIVTDTDRPELAGLTLDAFGGNSGGPVYSVDNLVRGIFVHAYPDADYVPVEGRTCQRPNRCSADGRCDVTSPLYPIGSEMQRIEPVIKKLRSLGIRL